MDKKVKKTSVTEKRSAAGQCSVHAKISVKKEIKSPEQKSMNMKPKVSTHESKDSQIGNLICQNNIKDVSIGILYSDIRES